MLSKETVIINKLGLHARAASLLAKTAEQFQATEKKNDQRRVEAKSIMALMMLAAAKGSKINIYCQGADEKQAMEALCQLVNNRFDEDE